MSIVEKAIKKMGERASVNNETTQTIKPRTPVLVPARTPTRKVAVAELVRQSPEYTAPLPEQRKHADEIRRIKRAMLERLPDAGTSKPREVLITSSVPAEGKTFTALSIALSVAQERDCGVLLIDGDLARPMMSQLLGLTDAPGLTDLLLDRTLDPVDVIVETDIPGLWFLPSGRPSAQSPELLASARMREVLSLIHAADASRVVLFDSPPLLASNEGQALGQLLHDILLIVRAQSTNPAVVSEALSTIPEGKSVSLVLNRMTKPHGRAFYGEYYKSPA
jgi:protein-tyrosine kinase